jgi:N-acetylmuramoyl-L-alanine amidase
MQEHTIRQGECLHSVAAQYGFFWETLWNHGANASLRRQRADPSVLKPGDVITIPDKEVREVPAATDKRHRFVKRGTPNLVRIQITRDDVPRRNEPYALDIDGRLQTGQTDGQGMVEMRIPPQAKQGTLRVGEGQDIEFYYFDLGTVDPVDTEFGARGRLRCLGYDDSQDFAELLKEFQHKERLPETGALDAATCAKLKERFGE